MECSITANTDIHAINSVNITLLRIYAIKTTEMKTKDFLSINEIVNTKKAKMNKNNYWLLYLIYGDSAYDKTASFQIPKNIVFKSIKTPR